MAGLTLAQAEAQLQLWLDASTAVAANQSYSIAGRSLSRVDAAEIRKQIDFWQAKVNQLSAAATGRGRISYGVVR